MLHLTQPYAFLTSLSMIPSAAIHPNTTSTTFLLNPILARSCFQTFIHREPGNHRLHMSQEDSRHTLAQIYIHMLVSVQIVVRHHYLTRLCRRPRCQCRNFTSLPFRSTNLSLPKFRAHQVLLHTNRIRRSRIPPKTHLTSSSMTPPGTSAQ